MGTGEHGVPGAVEFSAGDPGDFEALYDELGCR
jgi:hypothetical protein